MSNFKLGLSGGYSAGHILPMIALAEAWRRCYPEDEVLCYGSADGIEAKLIPQFKLPFQPLPARPLFNKGSLEFLRSGLSALRGMLVGRRHMRQHKLDAMICWGGYASIGAGLAAASLDCPLIVFESNAVPGRANTLLTRFAAMKLITMPELLDRKAWQDALVTALPLRISTDSQQRSTANRPARIMVTGGTFGSPLLNSHAPALALALATQNCKLEIYHQSGIGNEDSVRAAYAELGIEATVVGFDLAMEERWRWADAVLCAGGAGTLAEAIASGTPALAVPLAAASDNHQLANVKSLAARHDIAWTLEQDWDTAIMAQRMLDLLRKPRAEAQPQVLSDAIIHNIRSLKVRCN